MSERPYGNDGLQTKLINIDEYAVSWTWVTADFLLLKPDRGVVLEGFVNLQNEGHLAIVCWNLFSASISRERLPKEWKWVNGREDLSPGAEAGQDGSNEQAGYAENGQGYYVDLDGKKIEGMVKFKVKEIETGQDRERSFLTIVGTMLDDDAERELEKEDSQRKHGKATAGQRLGGARAPGATALGAPVEPSPDALEDGTRGKKHRTNY